MYSTYANQLIALSRVIFVVECESAKSLLTEVFAKIFQNAL